LSKKLSQGQHSDKLISTKISSLCGWFNFFNVCLCCTLQPEIHQSMMQPNHQAFFRELRDLIAAGDLATALVRLRSLLDHSPKLDEVIQQSGRFANIRREIRLGTVSHADATLTQNQIQAGVLELITEIEHSVSGTDSVGLTQSQADTKAISEEITHAISIANAKNAAINSSITAGGSIHFGDKNQTIIYQNGRQIPKYLTDLPFVSDDFRGREQELAAIEQRLFAKTGQPLLLVNGEGGMGKTSLAARYFVNLREQYVHMAWLFTSSDLADDLLRLAAPLGLDFSVEMPAEARLPLLLRELANLNAPCLIVLDNANEAKALRKVWIALGKLPNVHLLLTSRLRDFEEAREPLVIGGLPEKLALELFEQHYKALTEEERVLFVDLYRAVGGNTLVLTILAKNLHQLNRLREKYRLTDLVADLQQRGVFGLAHSSTVSTAYQSQDGGLRRETPEAILEALYDLRPLGETEAQVLAVFSVLPAENLPFDLLETLIPNTTDLDQMLLGLYEKGWLDYEPADNSFKCSPVVQQVTRKQLTDLWGKCSAMVRILVGQLDLDILHIDNYRHSTRYARLAEAVVVTLENEEYLLALLCERLGNYYKEIGNLSKAMFYFTKCNERSETLCQIEPDEPYNKHELAISYSKLGDTHSALGNLAQALNFFEQRSALGKELYEAYPQNVEFKNGLAGSYSKLGDTHSALGNLAQALNFFEQYNQLEKELYESYPQNVSFKNSLAISYQYLGITHSALGNLAQALNFFEDYNKLEKELYESYPQNVEFKNGLAVSYSKLGVFYRDKKSNPTSARPYFEQCQQLWQELALDFPAYVEFQKNLQWANDALAKLNA
jgi:tetratricopeptide (TPR) repeat protein